MGIYQHLDRYFDLPVATYHPETDPDEPLPPAGSSAWHLATFFDEEPFGDVFRRFLDRVDTTEVTALIFGYWGASYDEHADYPVPLLTAAADRFPNLKALFVGDITGEESEISWIEQDDLTPLLTAFPALERLDARGSGIRLAPLKSAALTTLRIETGGLGADLVHAISGSELPALDHLDLWLGTPEYGCDTGTGDLAPILSGEALPALRHLGLENAEIQDELAAAVAGAPVVARLESLSLAHGMLSDAGAEALLAGQPLTHLHRLDLHHHWMSDAMMERIRAALPGVDVDLGDQGDLTQDWRYITASE